jgi:hypothetical protein
MLCIAAKSLVLFRYHECSFSYTGMEFWLPRAHASKYGVLCFLKFCVFFGMLPSCKNQHVSFNKKKFSVVNKQEMWHSTCPFMKCHNICVFPIKLEDIPGAYA